MIDENNYQLAINKLKDLVPKIKDYDKDKIIDSRDEVYNKYKPIFSYNNINNITKDDFYSFLLFKNNHHWSGLHRQGPQICADMNLLRKTLLYILDETKPIEERVDHITYEEHVPGFGKAIFSAILLVTYPEKYAVWNNPSENGLKSLEIWPRFNDGTSIGNRYKIINQLLYRISKDLNIDLWTLDTLWWMLDTYSPSEDMDNEDEIEIVSKGINKSEQNRTTIWWVNQSKTLDFEISRGFLWAPKKGKDGRELYHWSTVSEVKIGDIIIHYSNGFLRYVSKITDLPSLIKRPDEAKYENWDEEGWQVKFAPFELNPPIPLKKFNSLLSKLNIDQGPLDINQEVKQGYLFRLSIEGLKVIQKSQPETKWPEYIKPVGAVPNAWIFQSNPKYYDLRSAVKKVKELSWRVTRYLNDVRVGDVVYLWEGGNNAGIIAKSSITSEPMLINKNEKLDEFVKSNLIFQEDYLRVKLQIDIVPHEPILKKRFVEDPVLSKMSIIHVPRGTNFKVTSEEAEIIEKLIEEGNGGTPGPETLIQPKYTIDDFEIDTGFSIEVIEGWRRRLDRKKQIIFQGPPGTGKTFVAQRLAKLVVSETNGMIDLVQFHPSYAYEDFIQGIRPNLTDDGTISYDLEDGRFLEFCKKAAEVRDSPCILIIDEINRANLSKVFGELMYLLEYRDNEIPLSSGTRFKIPENIFIIGTMNTADRSIAVVDHALRRRFSFIRLNTEYNVLKNYLKSKGYPSDSLVNVLMEINKSINDPNYEIGISYFMKKDDNLRSSLPEIWSSEIESYLEEYFFDQTSKVNSFRWETLSKNKLSDWLTQIKSDN